jgi:hypothetical protein
VTPGTDEFKRARRLIASAWALEDAHTAAFNLLNESASIAALDDLGADLLVTFERRAVVLDTIAEMFRAAALLLRKARVKMVEAASAPQSTQAG